MSSIKQNRDLEFPPESIHGIYGVNYYFQAENNTMQRLQFEVAIVFCGQYMENYYKYRISKNQFIVNRNESDEYLYDIAKKCANTIYPITVLIDRNRIPVYIKIENIANKWKATKAELTRYYKGETAMQYMDNVENFLNNKAEWSRIITDDLFLSNLFSILGHKEENNSFDCEITVAPFRTRLSFDCVQYTDNESIEPEESDIINIIREGITNILYTSDLLNQQAPKHIEGYIGKLSSKFKLNYTLEKASMNIESIEGNLDILVDDKCISNTKFTAFRLYEKSLPYGQDFNPVETEEQQPASSNTLWSKIKSFF